MSQRLYLGVDIGTYETKGVLVKQDGKIISITSRKHKMIVPQKGWAEHRPNEDWWGDFTFDASHNQLSGEILVKKATH